MSSVCSLALASYCYTVHLASHITEWSSSVEMIWISRTWTGQNPVQWSQSGTREMLTAVSFTVSTPLVVWLRQTHFVWWHHSFLQAAVTSSVLHCWDKNQHFHSWEAETYWSFINYQSGWNSLTLRLSDWSTLCCNINKNSELWFWDTLRSFGFKRVSECRHRESVWLSHGADPVQRAAAASVTGMLFLSRRQCSVVLRHTPPSFFMLSASCRQICRSCILWTQTGLIGSSSDFLKTDWLIQRRMNNDNRWSAAALQASGLCQWGKTDCESQLFVN